MKKPVMLLCLALVAAAGLADPVKALLVVQNHAESDFVKLSNLATRLSTALSGEKFAVIDPDDLIGEDQNRSIKGEAMPASSAVRLAESVGAQALITASVDDVSEVPIGSPALVKQLSISMTMQIKLLPSGATACEGIEMTVLSEKKTASYWDQNKKSIYSQLAPQICRSIAKKLVASPRVAAIKWPSVQKVMVAFGCNYPGADISIDGISYGTAGSVGEAPLQIPVSPGIHNLTVSYPFALPYKVKANFMANSTYMISLQPTEEGRRRAKDDAYFAELLDRTRKSGATDDFCRTERAKAYAKYLSSSHTRIDGMPQVLSNWNWGCGRAAPDLGLKPDQGDEGVRSTDKILKKAAEQVDKK